MRLSQDRDFQSPGRSLAYAANGMCATSHPHAVRVAVETLRAGGNAVDAGVAAAVTLGFCEPAMTGLGGDCFAQYAPPSGPAIALNGSGRSAAAVDPEALLARHGDVLPIDDAVAITAPGVVAGLCRLHEDYGRLERGAVLAPAIDAAENGVPVGPRAAWDWAKNAKALRGAGRRFFLKNGETPYLAGDLFQAPMQAEALRRISAHGASAFYQGEVAEDIVATVQALGGALTLEDLAGVAAEYVEPISTAAFGYEVATPPPNGQGVVALLMLDMLARFDGAVLAADDVARVHVETEIAKLAYDARNRQLADLDVMGARLDRLRSTELVDGLVARIDMDRAIPPADVAAATEALHKDTVYIAVADKDGGVLSLICSIFHGFGSGVATERFGVLLHNRGAGFTLTADHPNQIAPRKRPLHTNVPGLVRRDGRVVMSYGVMGGQYQAAGHMQLLRAVLGAGLDLQSAIDAPRSFPEHGLLMLETGFPKDLGAALAAKGHRVDWSMKPIGGAQAIWIDHDRGVLIGGSDPRKDGCALGW